MHVAAAPCKLNRPRSRVGCAAAKALSINKKKVTRVHIIERVLKVPWDL